MNFTVKKLTPNIGAEVIGLDIAKGISAETAAQLKETLEYNYVVLIRNQKITPEQQVEYARAYGKPDSLKGYGGANVDSSTKGLPPEIFLITNDPKNDKSISLKGATHWHMDMSWSKLPSKGAVLFVQQLPACGTVTKWCSLYAAYDALPAEKKAKLEKLRAIHSVWYSQKNDYPDPPEHMVARWKAVPPVEQPLVWTHKDGRKSMVLGPTLEKFVGMSEQESQVLRKELEDWCTQPQFVYEHHWKPGDLLVWYNSATMHEAPVYTGPELRLLHRITIDGDEEVIGCTPVAA